MKKFTPVLIFTIFSFLFLPAAAFAKDIGGKAPPEEVPIEQMLLPVQYQFTAPNGQNLTYHIIVVAGFDKEGSVLNSMRSEWLRSYILGMTDVTPSSAGVPTAHECLILTSLLMPFLDSRVGLEIDSNGIALAQENYVYKFGTYIECGTDGAHNTLESKIEGYNETVLESLKKTILESRDKERL